MGFLKNAANDQEDDPEGGQAELYLKLFNYAAADFLTKGDFIAIMRRLLLLVDPTGSLPINFGDSSFALAKVLEYQAVLDSGKEPNKLYKGLIDLSED
jgi:hypothetical protein